MDELVTLTGASGRQYRYQCLEIGDAWNDAPGNYAFVAASPTGFAILYLGEAGRFRDRLVSHERWAEAAHLGATHVLARCNYAGEGARREELADLSAQYRPALDDVVQLRPRCGAAA